MEQASMSQTLKIVVGSQDGLYFEEEVWEEKQLASKRRFEDIGDADLLFALLSLRIRRFVEGVPEFHKPRMQEAVAIQEELSP